MILEIDENYKWRMQTKGQKSKMNMEQSKNHVLTDPYLSHSFMSVIMRWSKTQEPSFQTIAYF